MNGKRQIMLAGMTAVHLTGCTDAACGAEKPEDMYGTRLTTDDLTQFFGITLDTDPLTMTGTARNKPQHAE